MDQTSLQKTWMLLIFSCTMLCALCSVYLPNKLYYPNVELSGGNYSWRMSNYHKIPEKCFRSANPLIIKRYHPFQCLVQCTKKDICIGMTAEREWDNNGKVIFKCFLYARSIFKHPEDLYDSVLCDHFEVMSQCAIGNGPCQNGGKCVPNFAENTYSCECINGYSGINCQSPTYDDCEQAQAAKASTDSDSHSMLVEGKRENVYCHNKNEDFEKCSDVLEDPPISGYYMIQVKNNGSHYMYCEFDDHAGSGSWLLIASINTFIHRSIDVRQEMTNDYSDLKRIHGGGMVLGRTAWKHLKDFNDIKYFRVKCFKESPGRVFDMYTTNDNVLNAFASFDYGNTNLDRITHAAPCSSSLTTKFDNSTLSGRCNFWAGASWTIANRFMTFNGQQNEFVLYGLIAFQPSQLTLSLGAHKEISRFSCDDYNYGHYDKGYFKVYLG